MNASIEEIHESEQFRNSTKLFRIILDSKYEYEDLNKLVKSWCKHLTEIKRNKLFKLLQNFEELLYGTLGACKTDPVDF